MRSVFFSKIILTAVLFSSAVLLSPLPGATSEPDPTEQKEILVIGTGSLIGGNVAAAKRMALSEALVRGIEKYLVQRLGIKGVSNHFSRIIHEILPNAEDEIENYLILAEDQIEKKYKVLVRIKINEVSMEKRLRETGIVRTQGPPIKILFLVAQTMMKEGRFVFWWQEPSEHTSLTHTEVALNRAFDEQGFRSVDRIVNAPTGDIPEGMKVENLTDQNMVAWGKRYSADIVLGGTSEINEGEFVSIALRCLDVETGAMITRGAHREEIKEGGEVDDQNMDAIDRASSLLARQMVSEIQQAFEVGDIGTNTFEVALHGLTSFKQFRVFKDFLKRDIAGVQSVIQKRISGSTMTISVTFAGDADGFLNKVLNHERLPFTGNMRKDGEGKILFEIENPS
jgi:hypothetical protein